MLHALVTLRYESWYWDKCFIGPRSNHGTEGECPPSYPSANLKIHNGIGTYPPSGDQQQHTA